MLELPVVLPFRMIIFQILLLVVAIATEMIILRRGLNLSPQKSVEYATTLNYLSTTVGWVLFFSVQPFVPSNLQGELFNAIFFDRWQRELLVPVVLAAIVTFFASFFIKLLAVKGLRLFLGDQEDKPAEEEPTPQPRRFGEYRRRELYTFSKDANTILRANAASFTAITLVLLLRLIAQRSITLSL